MSGAASRAGAGFAGVAGRDFSEAVPHWPEERRPPTGAPNVVVVVLDDVGFAQLGCFGSDLATPTLDRLAGGGLRYANFHTTSLCSPTRACLLTGRNHHRNGMGRIAELATGFPGYNARIPAANGMLSEILLDAGYATFAVGKWHLAPEEEGHVGATRRRWPLGRGFERFYGFLGGETHQFVPALVEDNHPVPPPRSYEQGYHLTEDLVDHAVTLIDDLRAVDPAKPFFLWFCPGACHAPHQPPREWMTRYCGAFDDGWDRWREQALERQITSGLLPAHTELSPRPDWVPSWDSLSRDEQRLYARYMEAFAGYLSHTDDNVGRLVAALERSGDLDNTLLIVLSDNGASSEGGPFGSVNDVRLWNVAPQTVAEAIGRIDEIGGPWCHNNYPWGWTVAGNTPFRRWKREVHEGGVADPLLVHWPAGVATPGQTRSQYVHAIDILPTVLDAVGIDAPMQLGGIPQSSIDGASFAATFSDPGAKSPRTTQYYEMFGCRALYHDGWKAVTYHTIQDTSVAFDDDIWELYDVRADPSECHDLAEHEPQRLRSMVERWWSEAGRNQVLPLDNRAFSEFVLERPPAVPARHRYVYRPGGTPVPEIVAVNVRNRDHRITVACIVPSGGGEGVLVAQGSGLGGWAVYVLGGRPGYVHNYVSIEEQHVAADTPLEGGRHEITYVFSRTGEHSGIGHLLVDGTELARGEIPHFTPVRFSLTGAGLTCGRGDGLPVSRRWTGTFPWTGTIEHVVVDVDGAPFVDPEGEAEAAITTQ